MNDRAVGDELALRDALSSFARLTQFPIVFGGFVDGRALTVSQLLGHRRESLNGLRVNLGFGLGGRVLAESRPRMTSDYAGSTMITHDYDTAVLAEGISTLLAVPVVTEGHVVGILYGGLRTDERIGGVTIKPALRVADNLAQKIQRRYRTPPAPDATRAGSAAPGLPPAQLEELRLAYAELRRIGAASGDSTTRVRLAEVASRLARAAGDEGSAQNPALPGRLTARELDVLGHVALGQTNARIGSALGLTEATVKSYLSSAMQKLGASTRHEATAIARRSRVLP